MRLASLALASLGISLAANLAFAADRPGSKDPLALKRFQGSEIVSYATRSFDRYNLALAGGAPGGGFGKIESVEGAVTSVIYRVPKGHTALELLRNYEHMLTTAGFAQTFEIAPCTSGTLSWSGYFYDKFFFQSSSVGTNPFHWASDAGCYATFKANKGGHDTSVAVLVTEIPGDFSFPPRGENDPKNNIAIKAGEVLVGIDVVTSQAPQYNMVDGKTVR